MQSRLLEQIPRFGWDKKTLIDDIVIGDAGGANPVATDPVRRPPGLFQAAVQLIVPAGSSGGVGEFGAVLEGSNTGDGSNDLEWFPIASLDISNLFQAPDASEQFKLMGAALPFGTGISYNGSSGNISIGRFGYFRVRSEVRIGTVTVLAAPTTAPGATLTINGKVLTPAGGPRTPGNDDYDNTLGSTAAIAAEIQAALNDLSNSFRSEIFVNSISGSTITIIPQIINGFTGFELASGLPAELDAGPTFPITVRMTGTGGDGEAFLKNLNITSLSGEPNAMSSAVVERPAGTRYLTATAKLASAVWSPSNASGFIVRLEGAVDKASADAGNFVTISTESLFVTTGGPPATGLTALFNPTGGLVVDMGPFNFFRVSVENSTSLPIPTDITEYTIATSLAFDDNDWIDGEQSLTELSSTLQSQFLQVRWGTPEPQVGTTITIPGQFVDLNGVPIQPGGIRRVFVVCSNDFFGKVNQPHPTATLDSVFRVGGAANTTRIVVAHGLADFTVQVNSNGTPTTAYISADVYIDSPQSTLYPYTLISSEVATVVLT